MAEVLLSADSRDSPRPPPQHFRRSGVAFPFTMGCFGAPLLRLGFQSFRGFGGLLHGNNFSRVEFLNCVLSLHPFLRDLISALFRQLVTFLCCCLEISGIEGCWMVDALNSRGRDTNFHFAAGSRMVANVYFRSWHQ